MKLLNEISNNYHIALAVHREMADAMWFIAMNGYAMLHEYQYLAESVEQRRVKKYVTLTHHTYTQDVLPEDANIHLLQGKSRSDIDAKNIVKLSFDIYADWEKDTLLKYEKIVSELSALAIIADFNFVARIVDEVRQELNMVSNKIIELKAHNYDMPTIVAEQSELAKHYDKKIKKLLGRRGLYDV